MTKSEQPKIKRKNTVKKVWNLVDQMSNDEELLERVSKVFEGVIMGLLVIMSGMLVVQLFLGGTENTKSN